MLYYVQGSRHAGTVSPNHCPADLPSLPPTHVEPPQTGQRPLFDLAPGSVPISPLPSPQALPFLYASLSCATVSRGQGMLVTVSTKHRPPPPHVEPPQTGPTPLLAALAPGWGPRGGGMSRSPAPSWCRGLRAAGCYWLSVLLSGCHRAKECAEPPRKTAATSCSGGRPQSAAHTGPGCQRHGSEPEANS